jgi:RimJ/RimL family protein N-acetyltransferase
MFGLNIRVSLKGFTVSLRPLSKADLPTIVANFNSLKIHMYTKGLFAQTLENEEEWYEQNRKDRNSCLWGIVPEGGSEAIGITGLHNINNVHGTCVSGTIIWDISWWGKGVTTRAHLARTLFAAAYLRMMTIKSAARLDNPASVRALTRAGYNKIGIEPVTTFRNSRYLSTQLFTWINPDMVSVLYPEGLPKRYKKGVQLAEEALALAREVVSLP